MSRINCNVLNCSHNKDSECYANVINVGGNNANANSDTCCGSFLDSANYSSLTNNVNKQDSSCTAITCNVDTCVHNRNHLCNANAIDVNGNNASFYTETQCSTFESK